MPAICINPIDNLDAELLHKLNQQNQDVRLFISDKVGKEIVETFLGKKAIGDINDDSHISTASSGAYCGIFLDVRYLSTVSISEYPMMICAVY